MARKRYIVQVVLDDPETMKRLTEAAEKRNITRSKFVRRMIQAFLLVG